MTILETIRTANSNLRRSKLRTTLTLLAVFVGTLTLTLTTAVGSGVKQYIDKQVANVSADNALVIEKKSTGGGDNSLSGDVAEYNPNRTTTAFGVEYIDINATKSFTDIDHVTQTQVMYDATPEYITSGGKKYVASISSYVQGLKIDLLAGRLVKADDANTILIPEKYATALFGGDPAKAVGKTFTVHLKEPTGLQTDKTLTVVGVARSSIIANGSLMASPDAMKAMNAFMTQHTPNLQGKVQAAVVTVDPDLTKIQMDEIKKAFDKKGFKAQTLEDQIAQIKTVINGIQIGLNVFGLIALLAASFGIINTLLMAVYERTREIGLLKALGMGRGGIFTIFALEAISIGFWGGVLGIAASYGIGQIANHVASTTFLKDLEGLHLLAFPPGPMFAVLGLIMAISFLAGILPAFKASRLNPIEALRYE